ncbi:MAG: hypothetical protein FJ088_09485, partial [Deltaproteobacteria bacterium]|nr:hypothetical protein [Deltaproteobacteria bacterium]
CGAGKDAGEIDAGLYPDTDDFCAVDEPEHMEEAASDSFEVFETNESNPGFDFYITVNKIPEEMNCSGKYVDNNGVEQTCRLLLPLSGFSVDVITADKNPDWSALEISFDAPLGDSYAAFDDVSFLFDEGEGRFTFFVDGEFAFGESEKVTVIAKNSGFVREFGFSTGHFVPENDPFPQTDEWLVVFSRDVEEINVWKEGDGYKIVTESTANGIPDFYEVLLIIGLFEQGSEYEETIKERFMENFKSELREMFYLNADGSQNSESVDIRILFEGEEGSPAPEDYDSGKFSMIAVGSDAPPGTKYFGMAQIDWHNQKKNNDAKKGYGVFVTNMVRTVAEHPAGALVFGEINSLDGTPFGGYHEDGVFIENLLDDPSGYEVELTDKGLLRYEIYKLLMKYVTLGIAAVCVHEMGHSLGLVPPGAPPDGLFAGLNNLDFIESVVDSNHIDTKGLNIMQTGESFDYLSVLNDKPKFNPLNIAYLRKRLIVR